MFGVNISALLDSLDTVAKETLEEPKESATRIRSKRKQAASQAHSQSSENDLLAESPARDIDEVIHLSFAHSGFILSNTFGSCRTMKGSKLLKVLKKVCILLRQILPLASLWMRAVPTQIEPKKVTSFLAPSQATACTDQKVCNTPLLHFAIF